MATFLVLSWVACLESDCKRHQDQPVCSMHAVPLQTAESTAACTSVFAFMAGNSSSNQGCACLQVEQRKLREGAAAMAAELVTLRHHMAHLTSPTSAPNGLPPRRPSPNGVGAAAHMSPDPAALLPAAISGSVDLKVRSPGGVVPGCCV